MIEARCWLRTSSMGLIVAKSIARTAERTTIASIWKVRIDEGEEQEVASKDAVELVRSKNKNREWTLATRSMLINPGGHTSPWMLGYHCYKS